MPKASTRNPMATPGSTCTRVYSISAPRSTAGSMEATIKNFTPAAPRVQASLTLGRRLAMIPKTARAETRTDRNGFMEVIVSKSGHPRRYGKPDNIRDNVIGIEPHHRQSGGHQ